jgi:hypothetical protein
MPTTAKPQTITQVQLVPIPVMTPQAQGPMTTIPPPKDGQKQQPQPKQKQQATGPVNKVTSGTKLTTQQTKNQQNQKKPDVKKPNAPPPETTTPAAQTMMIDRQPQQPQQPNAMQMPMTMPMPMQSPGGQTTFYYMTPQGLLVPVQFDNVFPSQQSVFQQVIQCFFLILNFNSNTLGFTGSRGSPLNDATQWHSTRWLRQHCDCVCDQNDDDHINRQEGRPGSIQQFKSKEHVKESNGRSNVSSQNFYSQKTLNSINFFVPGRQSSTRNRSHQQMEETSTTRLTTPKQQRTKRRRRPKNITTTFPQLMLEE